ncbi:hypothetical protein [Clostridium butyricum]
MRCTESAAQNGIAIRINLMPLLIFYGYQINKERIWSDIYEICEFGKYWTKSFKDMFRMYGFWSRRQRWN